MKFHSSPFIYISSLLLCGVLAGDVFQFGNFMLFALPLVLIIGWFLGNKQNYSSVLFLISFFFIGILGISLNRTSSIHPSDDMSMSYVLVIEEISSTQKDWRKAICKVVGVANNTNYSAHQEKTVLFIKSRSIEKGDQLIVYTTFEKIRNNGNPGEFDAKSFWNNQNIYRVGFVVDEDIRIIGHAEEAWLDSFFSSIREFLGRIIDEKLSPNNASIAKALILGDKEMLSTETRNSFSNAGAMHVLAVSGLHVGILLYILTFIFSRFPRVFSKSNALLFAIIIIWFYAGITGFSPSVLRASFMFSVLSLGHMYSKNTHSLNTLFFSAFVLILLDPMLVYNIGFQLSYLAMIGILTLYKPISRLFYIKNSLLRKIWNGTAVGISAQLFTVPLTLYYFHQFPNYFVLTNLGMMVFAGLILGIGLVLFFTNWLNFLSGYVGLILGGCLTIMLFFVQFIEQLPGAVAYGFVIQDWILVACYSLGIILIFFKSSRLVVRVSLVGLTIVLSTVQVLRYSQLSRNEIVLLNNNNFAMLVKKRNQIVCLYQGEAKDFERIKHLSEAYKKVTPGNIVYAPLEKGTTTLVFKSDSLNISFDGKLIELDSDNLHHDVRLNYYAKKRKGRTIIDMPYMEIEESHLNLSNGSISVSIE